MAQISQEKWWHGGIGLAAELLGWLITPLLVAYFVGKWLDSVHETTPWLFLVCTGVAFVITCVGIVVETARFMRGISGTDSKPAIEKENKLNDRSDNNERN